MKFHFFHLMPYPDLPDDFRQRYHGVWVDLPAAELFDAQIGHVAYNEYLELAQEQGQVPVAPHRQLRRLQERQVGQPRPGGGGQRKRKKR